MQATGPPSRAPVNDGPFNCRPYFVLRSEYDGPVINLSVYLLQKVCIFIFYYTISISIRRDREEVTGGRDTHSGTGTPDRCQSYTNSHSRTPGQSGQRYKHYTHWDMDIVIAWPHTRRRISTMTTDSERRRRQASNNGRRPCRLSLSSMTTTSQTTDEDCQLRCNNVATTVSRRRRRNNDVDHDDGVKTTSSS